MRDFNSVVHPRVAYLWHDGENWHVTEPVIIGVTPYGSQMGGIDPGAIQGASVAANFIPGVGPFISAGIQILGALFGGGDPTPITQLWETIIGLRGQIADMSNQLAAWGVPGYSHDDFVGENPDDADTGGVQAAIITSEVLNKSVGMDPEQLRHVIKREDEYAAIKKLQSAAQALQMVYVQAQAHIQDGGTFSGGDGSGTMPGGSGSDLFGADTSSWAPWILGGGALVLGAVALMRRK